MKYSELNPSSLINIATIAFDLFENEVEEYNFSNLNELLKNNKNDELNETLSSIFQTHRFNSEYFAASIDNKLCDFFDIANNSSDWLIQFSSFFDKNNFLLVLSNEQIEDKSIVYKSFNESVPTLYLVPSKDIEKIVKTYYSVSLEQVPFTRFISESKDEKILYNLQKLWTHQANNQGLNVSDEEIEEEKNIISESLMKIIKQISGEYNNATNKTQLELNKIIAKLSFKELYLFTEEVKEKKLTAATKNVQNWLYFKASSIDQSEESLKLLIDLISTNENFDSINSIIELDSMSDEYKGLSSQIKVSLPKSRSIKHIYQLPKSNKQFNKPDKKTLVHGTTNRSVMGILANGLKKVEELDRKDGITDYSSTGNQLGNGIYFAKLLEANVSLQYCDGSKDSAFLFVADVHYDKANVSKVSHYTSNHPDGTELVIGDKVRSGRDEYVVTDSENIELKYLIEIE